MDHVVNHRPSMRLLIFVLLIALLGSELAHSASPAQAQAAAVADEQSLPNALESAIRAALGPGIPWIGPRAAIQQAKLTASDAATNDEFGFSVALSGDTALVGAKGKNNSTGVAYVFTRSGAAWSQQAKLTASDAATNDYFGISVALSGDTAFIGANGKNNFTGAVYVFTRSGTTWSQQQKLTASDAAQSDAFGVSVALSSDTALIGANGKNALSGAAYVFTRSGATWTQQATLTASDAAVSDQFGDAVAVSGDTALVGAFSKSFGAGMAYVFTRSGTTWTQQAALTPSDGALSDAFGSSVALSGDTALVGAVNKNNVTGAAYVFTRGGTTWTQQAVLTASDGAANDAFGVSVALSGDTALIGANNKNTNTGAAYVFTRSGATWSQQQKLTASDAATNDQFGRSVALSSGTVLVGANGKNTYTGAAYVFIGAVPQKDTIGVYKNGAWSLRNSNAAGPADITALFGGDASDLPVVGDWNGDGVDTIGVYRSSTGVVFLSNSNTVPGVAYSLVFGNPGDTPFAGRWDNTMTHDGIGVYRPSNGILYEKKDLTTGFSDYFAIFGNPGDQGVAGDWNGDGFDSIGVYRPTGTRWYMTNNGGPSGITYSDISFVWPIGSNQAVVGDWDGDKVTTVGYLTATGNFVLHSTNAAAGSDTVFPFGPAGAIPVAGKWVAPVSPANLGGLLGSGGQPTYSAPTPIGFE